MKKGYQLVFLTIEENILAVNQKVSWFSVAILYCLIERLYLELGEVLADMDVEVVMVYMHCSVVGYPTIGLHYLDSFTGNKSEICKQVSFTSTIILEDMSISELLIAIAEDGVNWQEVSNKLRLSYDPVRRITQFDKRQFEQMLELSQIPLLKEIPALDIVIPTAIDTIDWQQFIDLIFYRFYNPSRFPNTLHSLAEILPC